MLSRTALSDPSPRRCYGAVGRIISPSVPPRARTGAERETGQPREEEDNCDDPKPVKSESQSAKNQGEQENEQNDTHGNLHYVRNWVVSVEMRDSRGSGPQRCLG